MLKRLSSMERTRSLIIVGFAILMAVSLVMFYAPARNNPTVSTNSTEVLASVGNSDITVGDVTSILTAQGGDASFLNSSMAEMFLKQLIRERVIIQEAERLGLTASDEELAARIREDNKDASGKVDVQRYKSRVGDLARYENQVRDIITREKLRALITAGVTVSEEEVQNEFRRTNTTFGLVYVPVLVDKVAAKITPTEEEVSAYYEQHKTDYRILQPQKKIRYLFIDQNKMGEKLQIADAELRVDYDNLKPENKQAGVKVQQIVLKVARPDLESLVLEKATTLAAQARGTGVVTEEKFAELARGNSEDPATAKNGGALAGVVRKNPSKPDDPYQRVLDMQPGTITEPIKYGNAYYILRRGEAVPKTFEEAKQELLVSARNRKAYASTAALAQRAATRLKETKDFQKVAQEFAAEANMNPAQMIKETPFVVPGDNVPDIGSNQQFEQAIAPLENINDVGDRTPVPNGFAIPALVEKRDPNRIPDLAEVREKVITAFRNERAKSQLEETARNLANSANSAADLEAAAAKLGLEVKKEETYRIGSPLGDAGTSAATEAAIFNLKEGEVTKTPIKIGDNWVVIGATTRKEADLAEFAKQRDMLMMSALGQRRNQVFEDFILATQARMEREGKIRIYEDVLAKIGGNEPTITAPGQPRPPAGMPIQIPAE